MEIPCLIGHYPQWQHYKRGCARRWAGCPLPVEHPSGTYKHHHTKPSTIINGYRMNGGITQTFPEEKQKWRLLTLQTQHPSSELPLDKEWIVHLPSSPQFFPAIEIAHGSYPGTFFHYFDLLFLIHFILFNLFTSMFGTCSAPHFILKAYVLKSDRPGLPRAIKV